MTRPRHSRRMPVIRWPRNASDSHWGRRSRRIFIRAGPCGGICWPAGRRWPAATCARRMIAARRKRIPDILPIAPDTPRVLIEIIRQCTEPQPNVARPASRRYSQSWVRRVIAARQCWLASWREVLRPPSVCCEECRTARRSPHAPTWVAVGVGALLAMLLGAWPLWRSNVPQAATAAVAMTKTEPHPPQAAQPGASRAPSKPAPAVAVPRRAEAAAASPAPTAKVVQASAVEQVRPRKTAVTAAREFVISAARPVAWSQLRLQPGQTVRGRPGERGQIVIRSGEGVLSVDNVRFENIDFILAADTGAGGTRLVVTATHAAFVGCSFQPDAAAGTLGATIDWQPRRSRLGPRVSPAS